MKKCPIFHDKNPVVLNLMITDACNLHCSHCYVNSCDDVTKARYMTPSQLDFILKTIERENVELVHIFGGEPFMHPDIQDLCEMCNAAGMPVNIATNGTRLNEHFRWITKNRISLSINLMGDDQRLLELLRCNFPLDIIMQNAKTAVQSGVSVNGIVCPLPVKDTPVDNARFYASFLHRMNSETGINDFFLLYFSRLGRGMNAIAQITNPMHESATWIAFLKSIKDNLQKTSADFSVFCEPAFENDAFMMLPPPPVQCEMIMQANIVIRYDLMAFPCVLFLGMEDEKKKWGVTYDGNVDKLWVAFNDIQSKAISRNANTCKHCSEMQYCGPCVPYIQDELKDYRCKGKDTPVGCPLATVRLY